MMDIDEREIECNIMALAGILSGNIGACQCALLRALHIADCKRPPDKL